MSVPLTKSDTHTLSLIFSPESSAARPEILLDPSLPADRHIASPTTLASLRRREREAITDIEAYESSQASPAPPPDEEPAEKVRIYQSALHHLDALVAEYPSYASARNNRAQLRRWRYGDARLLLLPDEASTTLSDLYTALSLASPTSPTAAVSPSQARLLAQVYTQLGALHHAAAKTLDTPDIVTLGASLRGENLSREGLEEEASRLFFWGGLYGNEVARALAVHANPHARLCAGIVGEAMKVEMGTVES
ncbi:hypothetical protein M433DRAFT_70220 [Acidomyces richmondensis BFW]|nr:MAG: hypothetical protein FE78DRAFT_152480 [Acidomyces sp. 'richmondensis']KYG44090.1 hypothetical protein M433DRAFT_70220 [Acidomyces richmondensis BFW]